MAGRGKFQVGDVRSPSRGDWQDALEASLLLVECLVHGLRTILRRVLHLADADLSLALKLLSRAFGFHLVRAQDLADFLLQLARGFIGISLGLVCRAAGPTTNYLIGLGRAR